MKESTKSRTLLDSRSFGSIFNNDEDGIIIMNPPEEMHPKSYERAVEYILEGKPGILAQEVGIPDAVIYPSEVATRFDKYVVETAVKVEEWKYEPTEKRRAGTERMVQSLLNILNARTDPLTITLETCHRHDVPVLASYRMNAEDYYKHSCELFDLGRNHPEWRIPGTAAMDYAVPEVYRHRLSIFAEVAEKYDIDGIEMNFRRHNHMISNPLKNHGILTNLVRETRRMLDRAAARKGRGKLLLAVRVGGFIAGHHSVEEMRGATSKHDALSCEELGLDVKTWMDQGLVDIVIPSGFLAGVPDAAEFVRLAKDKNIGVYPTLFPGSGMHQWLDGSVVLRDIPPHMLSRLMRAQTDELCAVALQYYGEGADGISTFNWGFHHQYSKNLLQIPDAKGGIDRSLPGVPKMLSPYSYLPVMETQRFVHRHLHSAAAVRECLKQEPAINVAFGF